MVRDLEAPGKGVHVSIWQDLWHMVVKVTVMAAGARAVLRLPRWLCTRFDQPPATHGSKNSACVMLPLVHTCMAGDRAKSQLM